MPNQKKSVGFIGLGRMGGGMALNLLQRGVGRLFVFDASPEAMKALADAGAECCESPRELAIQCSIIFLCLPAAPEVREVLFGPGGIAEALRERDCTLSMLVDTTTLELDDAVSIAMEANDLGLRYCDCPVSGMPFRAQDGSLTVMFGGSEEAFSQAEPYLRAFGQEVIHAGPLGCGQAMKSINNIIYNVNIVALCEVLPLSVAVGLDSEAVARLVTTASSRSFASEYFLPRMMARQFDSDFAMADAYKDIVNLQQMARDNGANLPVVSAMIESYRAAMEAGYGREPKSAILKIYEEALGVRFEARDKFLAQDK